MKKKMPQTIGARHFVIFDRIFEQQVDVFLNYTPEQYTRWLNKNNIQDLEMKSVNNFAGWVSNYEDEEGVVKTILFMPKFDWAIKYQGTLVHEITHVIIKIWQRNNIPYNADTQEFLAWSIGRMYEDIAQKLLVHR